MAVAYGTRDATTRVMLRPFTAPAPAAATATATGTRLVLLAPRDVTAPPSAWAGFTVHTVRRASAVPRLLLHGADALLVDPRALGRDPAHALARLCEAAGAVPVLVLADPALAPVDAMRAGAQDVLPAGELTADRLALAVAYATERQRRVVDIRSESITDPLTGLLNRRGFRAVAEAHVRLLRRTRRESLLLFADVDGLKRVNDGHGHAAGDRALALCAAALRRSLRDSDVIARWGGDEFVALVLDASGPCATRLTPRVDAALEQLARDERLAYPLTMSIGITTLTGGIALDDALVRADRALYVGRTHRLAG